MSLLFGTAGTPLSSKGTDSISGIRRVHELGLGCMELEFVRGVKMGEKTARAVHEAAKQLDIRLSVHAPYYINLNAEGETLEASKVRIMNSARIGAICGAKSVVIHAGFIQKYPREVVYEKIKKAIVEIVEKLKSEGVDITLRIETMGRVSQFGSLEEALAITEVDGVLPCIDFSHLHAVTGKNNSREEFNSILARVEEKLGREGLDDMHIHVSGIEYSDKGEKKHLVFDESDLKYKELAQAFSDFNINGMVICESPNLEDDALVLKKEYDGSVGH
ncbi:MAG: TIM barrel protein [Euryarchaeota archaeon]|nr:TIM barrel protein [Euryarchaeota archaeon]MBU4339403.1 TIM barrel protein [Euryarchaeota archaeon]MBU4454477.1 TIM barrel protein [Euryarchaeota archaeon]MCG2735045.1 TIM barrel protein [Candidatus Methanoperedenaceae archaeon]